MTQWDIDKADIAIRLSRYVHNTCENVPHDIGLALLEIVMPIIQTADRLKEENERLKLQVDLYSTWMDGRTQCPPYGIPVLGYFQRSEDMEYELDIVYFELNEIWQVATTQEGIDVLFWHVLPEPPIGINQ